MLLVLGRNVSRRRAPSPLTQARPHLASRCEPSPALGRITNVAHDQVLPPQDTESCGSTLWSPECGPARLRACTGKHRRCHAPPRALRGREVTLRLLGC